MRMRLLAALLVSSPLFAQAVSLGLRAGFPATPMLTPGGRSLRYTFGPLVEIHLTHGAALAADFLLQRAELWRWEAPVTLVYRFRRPFLRAGVSANHVFSGPSPAELRHRGTSGFVAGAGLRFKLTHLWLDPELRLTHWNDRNFGVRDSPVRSNLNQIVLLIGVVF